VGTIAVGEVMGVVDTGIDVGELTGVDRGAMLGARMVGVVGDGMGVDTGIELGVATGVLNGDACVGAAGVTGVMIGAATGTFIRNGAFGDKFGGVGKLGTVAGVFGVDRGGRMGLGGIGVAAGEILGVDCGRMIGAGESDVCVVGVLVTWFIPFPLDFGGLPVPIFDDMPFPPLTGEDEVGDEGTPVGLAV
jgi:hypothetical protein